jgi:hypothetical protein
VNRHFTFFNINKIVVYEKISLSVIPRMVRPAWTAGVLASAKKRRRVRLVEASKHRSSYR